MLHFIAVITLFSWIDTLPHIDYLHVYNQVGNVSIREADTFYLEIDPYPKTQEAIVINRKLHHNRLDIESRIKKSCTGCDVNITIGSPSLKRVDVEITSGSLFVMDKVKRLSVSITSGDITLAGLFDNFNLDVINGNIKCEVAKAESFNISVIEGSVFLKSDDIVEKGEVNVLSGLVRLSVPDAQGFKIFLKEKNDTIIQKGDGELKIKIVRGMFKKI